MSPVSTERITGRALVDDALFGRLVHRVVHDQDMEPQLAERVLDQALAFLGTCAANPGARLSPSRLVDHGWHAFLMYTREYAGFCDRIAGRFLHHSPEDGDSPVKGMSVAATMTALTAVGYQVDTELWALSAECSEGSGGDGSDTSGSGNCSQCHQGCHKSN
ncbi:glycine-rich domain-containing protein [Kitasatospora sp. NPDC056531]|uniref:glycine-rich domain-containing protein n=1 Tax=Kitasatospora sp. NPDC056531 TaxID=3345856 RepID=UPI0036A4750C